MRNRTVIRWGGSYYVNIPKEVMRQQGEKQVLVCIKNNGKSARVYEVKSGFNILKEFGPHKRRGVLDWDLKL